MFNGFFLCLIVMLVMFFQMSHSHGFFLALRLALFFPLIYKIFWEIYKRYMIKSYLFICGTVISMLLMSNFFLIKSIDLSEFTLIYLSKLIGHFVMITGLELFTSWLLLKIETNRNTNRLT